MSRTLLCLALFSVSACALRPRYGELSSRFAPKEGTAPDVLLQVVDGDDVPVAGARVELGDRARFKVTTDQNGTFRLPLDKKYADENALVVVVLPAGVKGYRLQTPAPLAQRSPPLMSPEAAPPSVDAADAGVSTL